MALITIIYQLLNVNTWAISPGGEAAIPRFKESVTLLHQTDPTYRELKK